MVDEQINLEYKREFGSVENYLIRVDKNQPKRIQHLAKRSFLHRAILKYSEACGEVPECLKLPVQRLDEIVDSLNRIRESCSEKDKLDYDVLSGLYHDAISIIEKKEIKRGSD